MSPESNEARTTVMPTWWKQIPWVVKLGVFTINVFLGGMAARPYFPLPERVDSLESQVEMESDRTDLLVTALATLVRQLDRRFCIEDREEEGVSTRDCNERFQELDLETGRAP